LSFFSLARPFLLLLNLLATEPEHLLMNGVAAVQMQRNAINTATAQACNATFILTHWVRDRERLSGRPGLRLEQAVNEHCARPAAFCGMTDRGTIEVSSERRI